MRILLISLCAAQVAHAWDNVCAIGEIRVNINLTESPMVPCPSVVFPTLVNSSEPLQGELLIYPEGEMCDYTCEACPVGTVQSVTDFNGEKACFPCPVNTYNDETGVLACKACPANRESRNIGQSDVSTCYSQAGFYMNVTNLIKCSPAEACKQENTCHHNYTGFACADCAQNAAYTYENPDTRFTEVEGRCISTAEIEAAKKKKDDEQTAVMVGVTVSVSILVLIVCCCCVCMRKSKRRSVSTQPV